MLCKLQAVDFQEAASVAQQLIAEASQEHHEMLRECTEVRLFLSWLLQLAALLQDDENRSPALSATSRKIVAETSLTNDIVPPDQASHFLPDVHQTPLKMTHQALVCAVNCLLGDQGQY